jgi:hypothetical protein
MTAELGGPVEIPFRALKDFGLVKSLNDAGTREDFEIHTSYYRR